MAYQTALQLGKRGHQVTVVASDFGTDKAAFPEGPFQVVLFPNLVAAAGFYFSPQLYFWLNKHITEFDILHLHEVRTFQNIAAHSLAARYHIPYLLSAHGTLPIIVERHLAKRLFDSLFGQRILADARRLVAVSPYEVKQYQQAGIPEKRVQVLINGLNLAEYVDLPPQGSFRQRFPGMAGDSLIILFLGRLHQRKGINHLIEAFAHLHLENRAAILAIAGPDGGELATLQALTERLQLQERVFFVGPLYGRDKLAAYVDAELLATPAAYEIFGLVPFEALLCGTPVIVSDDCGTGQLIGEAEAGYLVPYGDVPRLANALQQALTSPEERRRMVVSGQRYIRENLDWDVTIRRLESVYQTCLNSAQSQVNG